MRIKVKVSIINNSGVPVMGPGPLDLLAKVKEHSSISQAAKGMNLSYVKALNMLNRLEKSLGHKLFLRRRGGNDRGGTELTPFAEYYLDHYSNLEKRVTEFANAEFQSFLKEIESRGEDSRN
ncbi:putative transcriptional regulator, ModE family [uncultured Desulfobacterium sp.]|uniref:Putative transcriptional regulator, ModE family n=1 Tax=uncultured Desulfobacterium sp. TaxID=201089 RepID=A0A445MWZ5_9BACT|nr:putative transcriptional regulator, ModE family [uncultured Desulfobacterium sp.]